MAQAGKFGAVTISTNMAGRGTDIMLGGNPEYMVKADLRAAGVDEGRLRWQPAVPTRKTRRFWACAGSIESCTPSTGEEIAPEADAVRAAGGLFILGTERHESRRIDNQLRGSFRTAG